MSSAEIPNISGISQINNNNNINTSAAADIKAGDHKGWLQQVQHRLEKYRHLATTNENDEKKSPERRQAPTQSSLSSSNQNTLNKKVSAAATAAENDQLVQMTRKEIEVLAAYHCELQRMIGDQNQKVDMMYDELNATHEMAERLQVEVEKKTGGGISPRRQAKQQMRQEIIETRRKIDTANNNLMSLQSELEGVKAEHAEVRSFISRQFFPVARVSGEQKWPPAQHDEKNFPSHLGNQFVVRPTKTAELRDQMVQDRKRGCVPGTNIKSTTYGVTEVSESRKKRRMSMSSRGGSPEQQSSPSAAGGGRGGSVGHSNNNNNSPLGISYESYIASAKRVKSIQDGELKPELVGHLAFKKKKIDRSGTPTQGRSSSSSNKQNSNSVGRDYSPSASLSRQSNAGTAFSVGTNQSTSTKQQQTHHLRAKSPLSQEKSVFTRREENKPFKGTTLHTTSETNGIIHHGDAVNHDYGY